MTLPQLNHAKKPTPNENSPKTSSIENSPEDCNGQSDLTKKHQEPIGTHRKAGRISTTNYNYHNSSDQYHQQPTMITIADQYYQ
jgi:hypothetical protein